MPFGSRSWLLERIGKAANQEAGLSCIRADDIPGAGFDLLNKVHAAIDRSELVIAEISDQNPNVFYEVGYAVGIQKPILLIGQRGAVVPTDLRGRELILYSEDKVGLETFSYDLALHLRQRVGTQVALLRDMLVSERPRPAYILASPRNPDPDSRITGRIKERRTFGDNLGIVRLLSTFGAIFGETGGVELVAPQYCVQELATDDINLYLIGSRKTNPIAGAMLDSLQDESLPRWRFGAAAGFEEVGDYPNSLYRIDQAGECEMQGRKDMWRGEEVHVEDHGLIVRGPHPSHPSRMVMVMAGAHRLGTAAACFAATDSALIRQIVAKGIDIARRDQTFWVHVRGTASTKDRLLDLERVCVLEAGVCNRTETITA